MSASSARKWYAEHKSRAKEIRESFVAAHPNYKKEWAAKHPRTAESRRSTNLRVNYGLTVEDYDRMFTEQGGRCAICGKAASLVVDHDHVTGRIRKLLCRECNIMLGCSQDSPETLRAAAEYLTSGKA